jgi:hypothetical protein
MFLLGKQLRTLAGLRDESGNGIIVDKLPCKKDNSYILYM